MKSSVLGRCGLLLSVVLLSGCRTDEDRCETLCKYLDKCGAVDSDCTEDDNEDCAEDVDDLGDSCREAFDELTDCIDENDNDCAKVRDHCQGEGGEILEECRGLL